MGMARRVHLADGSFVKNEVQFFHRELIFNFFKTGFGLCTKHPTHIFFSLHAAFALPVPTHCNFFAQRRCVEAARHVQGAHVTIGKAEIHFLRKIEFYLFQR